MRLAPVLSTCAVAAAVTGCVVMVAAMGRASTADGAPTVAAGLTVGATSSIPLMLPTSAASSSATSSAPSSPSSSASSSVSFSASTTPSASLTPTAGVSLTGSAVPTSTPTAHPSTHASTAPRTSAAPTTHAAPSTHAPAPAKGVSLPLGYSTGTATRVITVVASSHSSTVATLQAWNKAPGGGWLKYGGAITAHVGSAGLTSSPSEFVSATPIGSFSLTQAFGRYSNPGTGLSYFQTTPADWWISQSGPDYNTHQRCSSHCSFTQGSPNEHLYYETPYYNYAVVINTPSGASAYPHGSAFFLHVTDGTPTAGCVAIPQSNLVTIMRWLTPSAHPRILIGVT